MGILFVQAPGKAHELELEACMTKAHLPMS
jgi:hypothetical protein